MNILGQTKHFNRQYFGIWKKKEKQRQITKKKKKKLIKRTGNKQYVKMQKYRCINQIKFKNHWLERCYMHGNFECVVNLCLHGRLSTQLHNYVLKVNITLHSKISEYLSSSHRFSSRSRCFGKSFVVPSYFWTPHHHHL